MENGLLLACCVLRERGEEVIKEARTRLLLLMRNLQENSKDIVTSAV